MSDLLTTLTTKIDDIFGFNLSNNPDNPSYDFGQYRLNRLYKPMVRYFLKHLSGHLTTKFEQGDQDQIITLFLDFFKLYYRQGDFGYFKSKYSSFKYRVPYSFEYSGKDTEFWRATKDCYYVKTSDVVNDMSVKLGGLFEGKEISLKLYKITDVQKNRSDEDVYLFSVDITALYHDDDEYQEDIIWYALTMINRDESKEDKKYKLIKIADALVSVGIDMSSHEWVAKSITEFTNKRWRDYFIHKDLKGFLTNELEWYLFQVLKHDLSARIDVLTIQTKIEEIKAKYTDDKDYIEFQIGKLYADENKNIEISVYATAYLWIRNFINILWDLEEFKAKLWNKERKVVKQEYCISLGKVPTEYHAEILSNQAQINEWKELGMTAWGEGLFQDVTLVLDTKNYTGAIREKLITLAQSLEITGRLIKSDNYQALKWMQNDIKQKLIYIDPPYNTWYDDFIYKDNYKSSSWLSLMFDRIQLAKSSLSETWLLFVSIDDKSLSDLKLLLDLLFWKENFYWQLSRIKKTKPVNMWEPRYKIQQNIEYILVYWNCSMTEYDRFILESWNEKLYPLINETGKYRLEEIAQRRNTWKLRRDTMLYELHNIRPKEWYRWQLSFEKYNDLSKNDRIAIKDWKPYKVIYDFEEDNISYQPFWSHLSNTWTAESWKNELSNLLWFDHWFETVKPKELIEKIVWYVQDSWYVLDFFWWSWTTWHSILNLNKNFNKSNKFLMIELWIYFERLLLKRIKKVMYSDNRKDGIAVDADGTQTVVEYLSLNQYEDRFNAWGYLDNIEDDISKLESHPVTNDTDIKHLILPLMSLKDKIFALDDEIGKSEIH